MSLKPQRLKIYIFFAVISLFVMLWLPYVGEEAVYTISAYEMWYHHHYLINTLYGTFYGRPPLLSWLIIPLANLLGWQHVLIASRFISVSATVFVAFGLFWFVKRLTQSVRFALLCTAIYLTGDLLIKLGWLAYADPLLSFFIFFSIVFLWLAIEEENYYFLILGVVCVCAGVLVKALSPYWFYGLSGLVLLIFHPNRAFLFRPVTCIIHLGALAFPLIWSGYSDARYLTEMWSEMINTAFSPTLNKYFYQVFVAQPVMLFVRLLPTSLVAFYYYFKNRKDNPKTALSGVARIAFWVAFLNFAICWFAPRWPEARYYMPVFPFMAISLAYVIWNATDYAKKIMALLLLLFLIAKAVFIGYFYYRYERLEPSYYSQAKDILRIIGNIPLRADIRTIESAPIEKVAIYIDILRYPAPPILATDQIDQKIISTYNASSQGKCPGLYVIGQLPTEQDKIVKQYSQGKRLVYLMCRTSNEKSK